MIRVIKQTLKKSFNWKNFNYLKAFGVYKGCTQFLKSEYGFI